MLNTRNEEKNTLFYSYLACFVNKATFGSVPCACVLVSPLYYKLSVNTFSLNMYLSMSYTGLTRRNTVFMFFCLRHRDT